MVIHQETPNTGKLFQSGIIPTPEVFAFLLWALVSQPATCHLLPLFPSKAIPKWFEVHNLF